MTSKLFEMYYLYLLYAQRNNCIRLVDKDWPRKLNNLPIEK